MDGALPIVRGAYRFGTVLHGGHAASVIAGHVDKPTDSEASRCFAIATDASSEQSPAEMATSRNWPRRRPIPSGAGADDSQLFEVPPCQGRSFIRQERLFAHRCGFSLAVNPTASPLIRKSSTEGIGTDQLRRSNSASIPSTMANARSTASAGVGRR